MPWGWGRGACTNLQHCHVRGPVGSVFAAVDFHVFQPLDVRLGIAVDLAVKLHIAPNHHSLVGREPCLQDWSVGWPFWKTGKRINLNLLVLFSPSKYSLKHSSSGFSGKGYKLGLSLMGVLITALPRASQDRQGRRRHFNPAIPSLSPLQTHWVIYWSQMWARIIGFG